jgi:DNA (cytosine-5)-methyltransferase 1
LFELAGLPDLAILVIKATTSGDIAMNVVGLFAGIGGLEHGLSHAGHKTTLLCENWTPACAVLQHHFPDVPMHGDVRELTDLPENTEVLCAGFPCQDLSQAGKTAGIRGSRSSLVAEIFRLLRKRRVPIVLLENVPFMLHLDGGRALQGIVAELESLGYRWAYRVVNSLAFGLPQRRERVFLLAALSIDPADVLLSDDMLPPKVYTRLDTHAHGFYWTEGTRGLGWAPDAVPTLKNGSTVGIPSPPAILLPNLEIVTPELRDVERLQGFEPDWTKPAEAVGRASLRWSLIGNAVSVPVAEWLGEALCCPSSYDISRDRLFPQDGRWPKAARFDGRRRSAVSISAIPLWRDRPALHEFLRFGTVPLSAKATAGFLRRIEASSLRFVTGFKEAVRDHLRRMQNGSGAMASDGKIYPVPARPEDLFAAHLGS